MKTIKIGSGSQTFSANKTDTDYVMTANKTIIADSFGIEALGAARNREIEINGDVHGATAAIRIGSADATAGPVALRIGEKAALDSNNNAVLSYGHGHSIFNSGEIVGTGAGIRAYGAQTIKNTGDINGSTGVYLIELDGRGGTLRNSGIIDGASSSVTCGQGNDRIVNTGELHGDVFLGAGDDLFVFRSGVVNGNVAGGMGNDTYTLTLKGVEVVEAGGQGWDTVHVAYDYGLTGNVEVLRLIGKADIDGAGNGDDNQIFGNSGDNVLIGGFGDDVIVGGRGDDILYGGFDTDQFYFSKGCGHDRVVDFEAGDEEIHLSGFRGATGFADMMANHVSEVDGDVWITYGKDVIMLSDVTISELKGGDFVFM